MKKGIMIPVTFKVPRVPNFLLATEGDKAISIGLVPPAVLRKVGAQWTRDLLERAAKIRDQHAVGLNQKGTAP